MNVKKLLIPLLLILIPLLFFYKTVLFKQIPFPGDLLLGNYDPYRSDTFIAFPEGIPHKGQGADVIRELYPWKEFSVQAMKEGTIPLWNPYVFSGNTQFANLQGGVFYPVNVLFFIMPFIPAWTIYIILQYVFLVVFTYLYLRQIALSKLASILGSVAFSFSGFLIVWGEYGNLGHTICFLPLALYAIEKNLHSSKKIWYLLLIACVTCSIFAGYVQLTMYLLLLVAAYVIARFFTEKKKDRKKYILILGSVTAGVFVSAIQIIPLYEVLSLSLRSNYSYSVLMERLMPPESVITLLVPDFFGNPATKNYFLRGDSSLERAAFMGVWPFIFAFFALFSKKTFIRNFFAISAGILMLSVIAIPPVAYFHSIGIPFLSTGIPTRALSVMCFCLAVLAAIGVNSYLVQDVKKKKILILLGVFAVIFASLWAAVFLIPDPHLLVSRRNLIIPTAVFILGSTLLLLRFPKRLVVTVLIALTVLELFYSFQKFNSFVPAQFVYPKTHVSQKMREIQGIFRSWGYGSANIDTNFQIIEKIYGTDGYDPLFSKRYGEFMSASKNGKILLEVPRSVANIHPGYGVNELKQNSFRQRAIDLTGVKFVLNKGENGIDSAFSQDVYTLYSEDQGWQIYTNKNVLARVGLFGDYRVKTNGADIIKILYSPNFDFHKTLVLEKSLSSAYDIQPDASSSVKVIYYKPNEIKIQTQSSKDQLLFISDNYFPGWRAYVDQKSTPILRANYTFRAIPLKKGNHTVIMSYLPNSFIMGAIITGMTVIGLLGAAIFVTISTGHNKKHRTKAK